MVKSRGIPVHLGTMEPGAAYCVKVRTFVKAIGRHSPFSQAECVKVQGMDSLPLPSESCRGHSPSWWMFGCLLGSFDSEFPLGFTDLPPSWVGVW